MIEATVGTVSPLGYSLAETFCLKNHQDAST